MSSFLPMATFPTGVGMDRIAVAKVRERFAGQLSTDRTLRRTIQEITARMSHINGLLPKSGFEPSR